MGLSIYFSGASDGNDGPFELSSATGWSQVVRWIKRLDTRHYAPLQELAANGEVMDTVALSKVLKKALKTQSPPANVKRILSDVAKVLGVGDVEESATIVL